MVADSGDDFMTEGIVADHVFAGQGKDIILQEGFSFESIGSRDFIDFGAVFDEVFINTSAKATDPLIANSDSRAN